MIINEEYHMKDIIITPEKIKKELFVLFVCFLIASLVNIGSIIAFKTPWYEVFTQIGYVIVITLVLYLLVIFIRVVIFTIRQLFGKKVTN